MDPLESIVIEPDGPVSAAVIWLHGLGASGDDFVPVVPHLGVSGVRFVFPHAPVRPVTLNGGFPMRAWYDILHMEHSPGRNHPDHIYESVDDISILIEQQVAAGVPEERIVVAGFSQGGAVALHAVVRHPRKLAGGLILSAYELLPGSREAQATAENADTPLFFGHGTHDATVPCDRGMAAAERAREAGHPVDVCTWPMAHEVCMEELHTIGAWLRDRFDG